MSNSLILDGDVGLDLTGSSPDIVNSVIANNELYGMLSNNSYPNVINSIFHANGNSA